MSETAALVAITGTLVVFGTPLLLVGIVLYFKHRQQQMTHRTIKELAEKGLPVPSELLDPPRPQNTSLRAGLVLLGLGLGLALFFAEVGAPWSIGLIPGLMGLALLVSWKIEKDKPRA